MSNTLFTVHEINGYNGVGISYLVFFFYRSEIWRLDCPRYFKPCREVLLQNSKGRHSNGGSRQQKLESQHPNPVLLLSDSSTFSTSFDSSDLNDFLFFKFRLFLRLELSWLRGFIFRQWKELRLPSPFADWRSGKPWFRVGNCLSIVLLRI